MRYEVLQRHSYVYTIFTAIVIPKIWRQEQTKQKYPIIEKTTQVTVHAFNFVVTGKLLYYSLNIEIKG